MTFEHEIEAGSETDAVIHELLGQVGEPLPYSSDKEVANALAKAFGVDTVPMHEPNYTHIFDSQGVLPETEPIGYFGYIEVEPDDSSNDLLLMHGWRRLSEAGTQPLCICRSVLLLKERVKPSWMIVLPSGSGVPEA